MGTLTSNAEKAGLAPHWSAEAYWAWLQSLGVEECLAVMSQSYNILLSHPEVYMKDGRGSEAICKFLLHFQYW